MHPAVVRIGVARHLHARDHARGGYDTSRVVEGGLSGRDDDPLAGRDVMGGEDAELVDVAREHVRGDDTSGVEVLGDAAGGMVVRGEAGVLANDEGERECERQAEAGDVSVQADTPFLVVVSVTRIWRSFSSREHVTNPHCIDMQGRLVTRFDKSEQ